VASGAKEASSRRRLDISTPAEGAPLSPLHRWPPRPARRPRRWSSPCGAWRLFSARSSDLSRAYRHVIVGPGRFASCICEKPLLRLCGAACAGSYSDSPRLKELAPSVPRMTTSPSQIPKDVLRYPRLMSVVGCAAVGHWRTPLCLSRSKHGSNLGRLTYLLRSGERVARASKKERSTGFDAGRHCASSAAAHLAPAMIGGDARGQR
jgi:hypothetical protein